MVGLTDFGTFPDQTSEGGGTRFQPFAIDDDDKKKHDDGEKKHHDDDEKKEILAFFA